MVEKVFHPGFGHETANPQWESNLSRAASSQGVIPAFSIVALVSAANVSHYKLRVRLHRQSFTSNFFKIALAVCLHRAAVSEVLIRQLLGPKADIFENAGYPYS